MLSKKNETFLLIAWTVSLIATLGSLFYSEIVGYTPCELCWIQRIFMYPLVIIFGVALIKRELKIALPGFVMSLIGLAIAVYHYSLQKVPALQGTAGFCGDIPCNLQYVNYFGFITIPFLSLTAFLIITVIAALVLPNK